MTTTTFTLFIMVPVLGGGGGESPLDLTHSPLFDGMNVELTAHQDSSLQVNNKNNNNNKEWLLLF